MSKKIWIINQYGSLPSTGMGGRHRHLSRELVNLGYKVTLISARWTHGTRDEEAAEAAPQSEKFEGFRFYRIPVSKYKHAHDKKRIINWFAFAWRIRKLDELLDERPDVIIYSSPSLVPYLTAYRLARRYDSKLVFEVRDIWPLTLMQLGGFSPRHPFIRFMQWIEDFAYEKSDAVISNLEGSVEHMKSRGLSEDRFTWVPNGYSKAELDQTISADPKIIDAIRNQSFSVTYTGAIGEANSLNTVVESAMILKSDPDIHFNIVGRGRLENSLKEEVDKKNLKNVHFWGSLPKAEVQSVLKASDACVICWKDSELYSFGVAANKVFDYLYSARPIVNAYSGGYDLVSRYGAGITVSAENPKELSEAIISLASKKTENLVEMGINGSRLAEENHEYKNIAESLDILIERLLD